MKLETLFEKFELVADAPGAVARMRELVLHLAVRGKLVPQDSKDEPVVKLLSRIEAQKASLAKVGKLRGSTSVSPVPAAEGDFELPQSWTWVRFGEIMINRDGERIPVSKEERETKAQRYDYYGASGVIDKIDNYLFDKPLLLIGEDGANLINRSTPIAFIARGKYWVNNHAHVLDGVSEDFLRYIELHINAINLESFITGSAQPKMNQAKMNTIPIALPPLAEQKRIVAKVDELMALCDRLEAQQQERETRHAALARASLARFAEAPTPANLEFLFHKSYTISPADLRKSILTLAVQGKLLAQDSHDEPALKMLETGAKLPDGHVRRRKIMKRAPVAKQSKLLIDLPPSWEYADIQTLYDLNLIVDYADGNHGSLYPRKSEFGESGFTFVTARDITDGRVSWSGCAKLKQERAIQLPKGWAQGGDVLLTHNATVGRVARVEAGVGRFLLGTSVTFYRLNPNFLDPSYFYHVLCSPIWQSQLEAIMEQTTRNQVSIQKQAFFQIPVAPVAEQRRIVAKVDQLMALVDELETHLAASRATGEKLLAALVAELTTRN